MAAPGRKPGIDAINREPPPIPIIAVIVEARNAMQVSRTRSVTNSIRYRLVDRTTDRELGHGTAKADWVDPPVPRWRGGAKLGGQRANLAGNSV